MAQIFYLALHERLPYIRGDYPTAHLTLKKTPNQSINLWSLNITNIMINIYLLENHFVLGSVQIRRRWACPLRTSLCIFWSLDTCNEFLKAFLGKEIENNTQNKCCKIFLLFSPDKNVVQPLILIHNQLLAIWSNSKIFILL